MDQRETLGLLVEQSSGHLRWAVETVPDELFGRRPGPHLNSIGFIYFHVSRHWDWDMNILCRGQSLESDLWHRSGLSEGMGSEPLGIGIAGRGMGVGYNDAEVDAVPSAPDVLAGYHRALEAESAAYLRTTTESDLNAEIEHEQARINPYTRESRIRNVILHNAEHFGDILYVKGMLGMHDATYPGPGAEPESA